MATPIINQSIDNLNASLTALKGAMTPLPSQIEKLREQALASFATDTASGAIASFPDGADGIPVKSLVVDIDPVQDLHGYDNPWPAGGGKNLFDASKFSSSVTESGGTYTFSLTGYNADALIGVSGSHTYTAEEMAKLPILKAETYVFSNKYTSGGNLVPRGVDSEGARFSLNETAIESSTYYAYQFTLTADTKVTLVRVSNTNPSVFSEPQIELGTARSAWTPYSNICPITGFTGANIECRGKNLFDETSIAAATIAASGTIANSSSYYVKTARVKKNVTYYTNSVLASYWTVQPSKETSGDYVYNKTRYNVSGTFTAPIDGYVALRYGNDVTTPMLCVEPFTDFVPYNGQTIPITWSDTAGTVYGGTLDVTTGVLTKTMESVDMGTLTWTYDTTTLSVPVFYSSNVPSKKLGSDNMVSPWYKTVSARGLLVDNDFTLAPWNNSNSRHIGVRDSRYTDAETFKTAMSGVYLVYELETPVTYQLTPTEVSTILGANNIFADTGNSDVTYRADTALYIAKKLAE